MSLAVELIHQKLRAMRAAFAARSGDFPALARAFVNAYELQVQNANKRLANVEAMLAEGRYDEADALMLDEPPLLELCDGLRQIEADKQGVLNVCKVGLKRVVDAKLLERVKAASAARTQRPTGAIPPPLPSSVHSPTKRVHANASPYVRSPRYLVPVSIGIGVFGVLCLIISLVVFSLGSMVDPAVLASLELPASTIPAVDQAVQSDQDESSQNANEQDVTTDAETDPAIALPDGFPDSEEPTNKPDSFSDALQDKVNGTDVTETKRNVLVGQLQAARLLKGEVCVRLEIEGFTNQLLKDLYYSYEESGRPYRYEGILLNTENRAQYIKRPEYTTEPLTLIVEIEPNDDDLKRTATKIKTAWEIATKAIVEWNNLLRNTKVPRPQALELLIVKPSEPKKTASISDLQLQLAELVQKVDQVATKIAEHESIRARTSSNEEAKASIQLYSIALKNIQELIVSLQREVEALTKIDREFDTGTIMYIGRVEGGKLIDATELRATYVVGQAN